MTVPAVSASDTSEARARTAGSTLQGATCSGLLLILAIAPLPLAAVNATAWTLLAIASGGLMALAVAGEIVSRTPSAEVRPLRLPMILSAVVVAWILVQQLPLDLAGWNVALWDRAEQALGEPVTRSISLARERSLGHLLRLLLYAAIFLVAWSVGRRSQAATTIMRAIALIGSSYALYGLIVFFTGNRTVLWYHKSFYNYDLTGSFVNRNSFATFLGLCLLANLGVIARVLADRIDASSSRTLVRSSVEAVLRRGIWALLSLILMASALLLTHSRGGMIATLCGAAALMSAALYAPSLRGPWRLPMAALAGVGAIIMIGVAGSGALQRLVDSTDDAGARTEIYAGTIAAIREHPIVGTGLGTFEYVFPPHQSQSGTKLIEFAHNDYLESMLELGVPMALLCFTILAALFGRCILGVIRRRRNAIFPCVGVGASVLVAVHSAVDFSLQMPAVATIYAALLGMAVAQSVGTSANANANASPLR